MSYKQIFSGIYDNFGFGSLESRSGPGSTLEETKFLREKLKEIVKQKDIKSVVDIPCGDFNWMKEIVFSFESYTGGDIVEQCIKTNSEEYASKRIKFIDFDLLNDNIPDADLLIVRDIVGHFPLEDGKKIIDNILRSNCKYLLSTTWAKKTEEGWTNCGPMDVHRENEGVDYGRFYPVNLMAHPFNFPVAEVFLEEDVRVDNFDNGNRKALALWDLEEVREHLKTFKPKEIIEFNTQSTKNLTVVTGLWNINRNGRPFDHYIDNFKKLLDTPQNLFIFIEKEYEHLVWEKRSPKNTFVKIYELEDVKNLYSPFWQKTQDLRNDPNWNNITGENGWLKDSPQARLEWYNPIVMSKMFMLHDVTIWNPFDTEYFIWLDAGITNTVYEKYFTENNVLNKITKYLDPFLFLSYPYEAVDEIHGFKYSEMNRYAGNKVEYVCRGGLFGGSKAAIHEANSEYYSLLHNTLSDGLMGTEESIFTIMSYLYPNRYRRFELDSNGLVIKFIQALDSENLQLSEIKKDLDFIPNKNVNVDKLKVSIYMLTFNFPHQVEHTIQTWLKHSRFISNTRNILIDNSTNEEARIANKEICDKYGFEHIITNENTGINGGRFRAAQHFQESDSDYYLFLEDDMGIHPPEELSFCRNGFRYFVPNLYDNILKIMHGSDLDFLKLSYTEVYMDNNIQVSWYNVPQTVRSEFWPDYDKLPVTGLDTNCPRTTFNKIEVVDGLSYITGDIYYCNWPTIVGKKGNQKMFLDTTWARPYEQTWMSHMFQETKKGNLKPAVLLASPIHHNRIAHYKPEERREN
jgi:hypothetical protein